MASITRSAAARLAGAGDESSRATRMGARPAVVITIRITIRITITITIRNTPRGSDMRPEDMRGGVE